MVAQRKEKWTAQKFLEWSTRQERRYELENGEIIEMAAEKARHALMKHAATSALQASIAACHARAARGEDTDWQRIAAIYDALAQVAPSPVVELNRAVAVSMAFGPAAGLEIIDAVRGEKALRNYHWLPSVRADLLQKLGRDDEARTDLEQALALTANSRERELLRERLAKLVKP